MPQSPRRHEPTASLRAIEKHAAEQSSCFGGVEFGQTSNSPNANAFFRIFQRCLQCRNGCNGANLSQRTSGVAAYPCVRVFPEHARKSRNCLWMARLCQLADRTDACVTLPTKKVRKRIRVCCDGHRWRRSFIPAVQSDLKQPPLLFPFFERRKEHHIGNAIEQVTQSRHKRHSSERAPHRPVHRALYDGLEVCFFTNGTNNGAKGYTVGIQCEQSVSHLDIDGLSLPLTGIVRVFCSRSSCDEEKGESERKRYTPVQPHGRSFTLLAKPGRGGRLKTAFSYPGCFTSCLWFPARTP